mmetsp:Transcript_45851/g.111672  ORF Transcript_45851/g.111672 Transcript_45851/m.111672 type:complete len:122 (-) Transcript_45851:323-688(-)
MLTRQALFLLAALVAACSLLFGLAQATSVNRIPPLVSPSKMARGNPERALTELRRECENHDQCTQGLDLYAAARRICIYRCMSDDCYQEVYGEDELEEGEIDSDRYRKFGECFRRKHAKES